jgi:hypothetical protein
MFLLASAVASAECGLALMQQHDTSTEQSMIFWPDVWSQIFPKEVALQGTGDCGPRVCVVLCKLALENPK